MKKLLFVVFVLAVSRVSAQPPINHLGGLGKDRETITAAQLGFRAANVRQAREFWLLRHPDAKDAWKLGHESQLRELVRVAVAPWPDVRPEVLMNIMFVESSFKPRAKSPSGPTGIAQLSRAVVDDYNKTVDKNRRLDYHRYLGYHIEQTKVARGKGKNRKEVIVEKKISDYDDDRNDPAKALPVMAWYVHTLIRTFGREDLGIQAYHDGPGRMLEYISRYTGIARSISQRMIRAGAPKREGVDMTTASGIVQRYGLSWPLIFFHNTPTYKSELFKYLEEVRIKHDWGPTYYFTTQEAEVLLALPESEYAGLVSRYVNRFGKTALGNPIFAFYSEEEWAKMRIADLTAIEQGKNGKLVELPKPWKKFGVQPRLEGRDPIGQMDRQHQMEYVQATPETIGCLLYIASELREYERVDQQRRRYIKPFEPIEIPSLVRSDEYQIWLQKGRNGEAANVNSVTNFPTHVLGKAFDIAFAKVKNPRRENLLFILNDLKVEGMIELFFEEKAQATIHVVPYPQWEGFFISVYNQAAAEAKTLAEADK